MFFNGGTFKPFQPFRGIKQGDSFSPYLFILCMEVLGFLIFDKCPTNLWNPVKASRDGLAFTHLFFVDTLILLAKVCLKNCHGIRNVLEDFRMLFKSKGELYQT